MDLVDERQEQRLAILERVVTAPAVECADLRRELVAAGMMTALLLTSAGALLALALGALWLLG